tara:strand:- start:1243 stop:2166 length:924 start_codon:yes stop_codon:yes gene_type:complete
MNKKSRIYIAGHRGMVGSAITRHLIILGYKNLITKSSDELNLINQNQVNEFFIKYKPEYVFLAAAKVGGIVSNNTYGADFIYENIMIQSNVINASFKNKVKKLLFLGSSCIYPKNSINPINEDSLLTGELEKTNEAYSIAKISGLKMCEYYNKQYKTNYISVMPTNLYGPNDNYDLQNSHVLPALLKKFHDAKINNIENVIVWGSGKPKREFLHVDDLAEACIFLICNYDENKIINVGSQKEISIIELAELIKRIVGYEGNIIFDSSKPDGVMQKLMNSNKINKLGWNPKIPLDKGIRITYHHSFKI